MQPVTKTRCPTCRKLGNWLAGDFAPFCSKRCRLIDLGKWLGEEHRVSQPLGPGDVAGVEDPPSVDRRDKADDLRKMC